MLFAAVPEYKIDLPSSWMIGDSEKEQKAQDAAQQNMAYDSVSCDGRIKAFRNHKTARRLQRHFDQRRSFTFQILLQRLPECIQRIDPGAGYSHSFR